MGIAAYNRGSRLIRRQIDEQLAEARKVRMPAPVPRNQCQLCRQPLGIRLDRSCIWSNKRKDWIDACDVCKQQIRDEDHNHRS